MGAWKGVLVAASFCLVGCNSGYQVNYPRGATFCVIDSYGDNWHPDLADAFRKSLYASKLEGFTFVPDSKCRGAFVISTTYSPNPPETCRQAVGDEGGSVAAGGGGLLLAFAVVAAEEICRQQRSAEHKVYTEVMVIEKAKGWKVDVELWPGLDDDEDGREPARQMAIDLANHLAKSRAR